MPQRTWFDVGLFGNNSISKTNYLPSMMDSFLSGIFTQHLRVYLYRLKSAITFDFFAFDRTAELESKRWFELLMLHVEDINNGKLQASTREYIIKRWASIMQDSLEIRELSHCPQEDTFSKEQWTRLWQVASIIQNNTLGKLLVSNHIRNVDYIIDPINGAHKLVEGNSCYKIEIVIDQVYIDLISIQNVGSIWTLSSKETVLKIEKQNQKYLSFKWLVGWLVGFTVF